MCLTIIVFRVYIVFFKSNITSSIITTFIILFIITSLFAIFDWFCYALIHSLKNDIPLSNKIIRKGKNYKDICLLLSGIFCLAIVAKIIDSLPKVSPSFYDIKGYPLWYCIIMLFITTFYLCIVYTLIIKHRDLGITDTIDKIGTPD